MNSVRHLYVKIYSAFLLIVVSSLLTAGLVKLAVDRDDAHYNELARGVARLVVRSLPPMDSEGLPAALETQGKELGLGLVLWDSAGRIAARTSSAPEQPEVYREDGLFRHRPQIGIVVPLDDGRQLGAFVNHSPPHARFFLWLVLFAAVVAIGCYPLARGITGRLERLQKAAKSWSTGSLSVRAPVEGTDEIAALALTLNKSAERIEGLVAQQKRVLASASHELRSPLARLQMALSLIESAPASRQVQLLQSAEEDVHELDRLIEDLLLTARAEQGAARPTRLLDLLELVQNEAQKSQLVVNASCERATIHGDAPMLRSLIRNLLENAQRHAGGNHVEIDVSVGATHARLTVADRGPGVAEDQAQRIFEPFYRPQGHHEGNDRGVGLGLALVKQVAQHHGGNAWYEPRNGGGSTFVVEFSLPTEQQRLAEQQRPTDQGRSGAAG